MKRHFYQFSCEMKLPNGYATGDIQLSFELKLRPFDLMEIRSHIKKLNENINVESVVFLNIFYIGEFEE